MQDFNFKDVLIDENSTVKESMKKLNEVASRILFVVSENNHFLGSLTDGDIRRFILSNGALDSKIIEACNKNCFKIHKGFDIEKVLLQMDELDIIHAPIIDDEDSIIDVFTLPLSKRKIVKFPQKKIDVPVVIMAGGKGTRMAPFTNVLPKPLIPVGDKTILELIIDEFKVFGIYDYYLTINYRGEMIKAYFDCIEKDYKVNYLKEDDFLGTAGSLKLLPSDFQKTFIVSNCDIIVNADYSDVLEFHKNSGALLTVISSIQHHKIPYGVINFEAGGIVTGLEEKPEYSFCINTGVYILDIECLKYIPEGEVFHMTHLMESIMKDGKIVATYPVNESEYVDIGQWDEYRKAVSEMKLIL
jgi:dTDP-glucose pyrophosphorylase